MQMRIEEIEEKEEEQCVRAVCVPYCVRLREAYSIASTATGTENRYGTGTLPTMMYHHRCCEERGEQWTVEHNISDRTKNHISFSFSFFSSFLSDFQVQKEFINKRQYIIAIKMGNCFSFCTNNNNDEHAHQEQEEGAPLPQPQIVLLTSEGQHVRSILDTKPEELPLCVINDNNELMNNIAAVGEFLLVIRSMSADDLFVRDAQPRQEDEQRAHQEQDDEEEELLQPRIVLLTPEGQNVRSVLAKKPEDLRPCVMNEINALMNDIATGDFLSTVRTSIAVDFGLTTEEQHRREQQQQQRGLTITIVHKDWHKIETKYETAVRLFPDILQETRDGIYLIQWMSMRRTEDIGYNLRLVSLIPLIVRLGIQLQIFNALECGGLLSLHPSGWNSLQYIICYHRNELTTNTTDECYSAVVERLRKENHFMKEDIQQYNLVGNSITSTNDGYFLESRIQYLIEWDPMTLLLPCYPEHGDWLPIHWSTSKSNKDSRIFKVVLMMGMKYFPEKLGFAFSEGTLRTDNGTVFCQGTPYRRECQNYGQGTVTKVVMDCIQEYCSSSTTSTAAAHNRETSLLLSAITDDSIHVFGVYILLRKNPVAVLLRLEQQVQLLVGDKGHTGTGTGTSTANNNDSHNFSEEEAEEELKIVGQVEVVAATGAIAATEAVTSRGVVEEEESQEIMDDAAVFASGAGAGAGGATAGGAGGAGGMPPNFMANMMNQMNASGAGAGGTGANANAGGGGAGGAGGMPPNFMANMMNQMNSMGGAAGAGAGGAGGAGSGMPGGMPGMPGGGQIPNTNQMLEMLDNPMMSQMMQQMVDSNPGQLRQMIENQNPMMRQMFQNMSDEQANSMIRSMMNPQMMRSMIQMQQQHGGGGTMPGGGMGMGGGGMPGGMNMNMMNAMMSGMNSGNASGGGAAAAPSGGGMDFSNLLSGTGGGTGSGAGAGVASPDFSRMMQQMQGMMGGTAGSTRDSNVTGNPFAPQQQQSQQQHPADRYRNQLQSLRDMGFDNEQQCLQVLQQNHGNVNRAVDILVMSPPPLPSQPQPPSSSPQPSSATAATSSNAVSAPALAQQQQDEDEAATPPEPKDAKDKKDD